MKMTDWRNLHFSISHPSDGRALRYHFDEYRIGFINRLFDRLTKTQTFSVFEDFIPRDRLRSYVRQLLYQDTLITAECIFRIQFLASRNINISACIPCPLELHDVVSPELLGLPNISLFDSKSVGYKVAKRAWESVASLKNSSRTRPHPTDFPWQKKIIAVELAEGANLSWKSDIFWLTSNAIKPKQVLFIIESQNMSLFDSEEQFDIISSMGARVVSLAQNLTCGGKIPFWAPASLPSWAASAHNWIEALNNTENLWLLKALKQCVARVAYWEAFFLDHNVLIIQNFYEGIPDSIAKRIAINRLGGIEIGKMRSEIFERSAPAFHFSHEVAFLWNSNVLKSLEYSEVLPQLALETGYVYDYLLEKRKPFAQKLRDSLVKQDVKFVVAVFDNSPHPSSHTSSRQVEEFYQCIADIVEGFSGLGIILKPKKGQATMKYRILRKLAKYFGWWWLRRLYQLETPDIRDSYTRLLNTGRVVMLHGVQANVIDAGLAADLVVGFPCSTAGCEAALAGKIPLLMYDPSGASGNPITDPTIGVSYKTIKEFRNALMNTLQNSSSAPNIAYLHLIDSFCDGKSAQRAGTFLASFLDSHERGLSKNEFFSLLGNQNSIIL